MLRGEAQLSEVKLYILSGKNPLKNIMCHEKNSFDGSTFVKTGSTTE